MYAALETFADSLRLMSVQDDAMVLTNVRTNHVSRDFEVVAGEFTDYREKREYPDFGFAFIYSRNLSVEEIRMSLFAWLDATEKAYNANRSRFSF